MGEQDFSADKLIPDDGIRLLSEIVMAPSVITDFVPSPGDLASTLRILLRPFAVIKKVLLMWARPSASTRSVKQSAFAPASKVSAICDLPRGPLAISSGSAAFVTHATAAQEITSAIAAFTFQARICFTFKPAERGTTRIGHFP